MTTGWRRVPEEPTPAMINAALQAGCALPRGVKTGATLGEVMVAEYKGAIAAAPKLHQAEWPYVMYEQCDGNHAGPACRDPECWLSEEPVEIRVMPKPDLVRSMPYVRFWQEVYIAAVRSGKQSTEACGIANKAVDNMKCLSENKSEPG